MMSEYKIGTCSVPMWSMGSPAGRCDKPAFGPPTKCGTWRDAYTGEIKRNDGKYNGYVPDLACVDHGGPECPGIELGDGNWSGCDQSAGDCPTCGK